MFSKLFFIATLAIASFAAPSTYTDNYCDNGSEVQCCNELHEADSSAGVALLQGLGNVPISNPTGQIGVTCTSVGALIGAGGGVACSSQPVCCQQNNINNGIQVVSINCSPFNAGA